MKTLLVVGFFATWSQAAWAAEQQLSPQTQMSVHGDFIVIGQSMGYECGRTVPTLLAGAATCPGAIGSGNTSDTSPDIFWASVPPSTAVANDTITPATARTTALLTLPTGSPGNTVEVRYARLFWSAFVDSNPGAGQFANLTLPGATGPVVITADRTVTATSSSTDFYQSSADVTAQVIRGGSGQYTVDSFKMDPLDINDSIYFAGWYLVVIFETSNPAVPQRHIAVFNGFDFISGSDSVELSITGFLVPATSGATDTRIGVVSYEGDDAPSVAPGDQLEFKVVRGEVGVTGIAGSTAYAVVSNALNPADDFFNGSNTFLGQTVSSPTGPCGALCLESDVKGCYCNSGNLPRTSGEPLSGAGMDIDVFDVGPMGLLKPGDIAGRFRASTSGDFFGLSGFITSFATLSPAFTTALKTVEILGGVSADTLRPGDRLRYTIAVTNTGNDPAINSRIEDTLDSHLTLDQTSLRLSEGVNPPVGILSSMNFTFVPGTRLLTVPIGNAVPVPFVNVIEPFGPTWYLSFEVTINAGTPPGALANVANIKAAGKSGATEQTYGTSGTSGPVLPNTPTVVTVAECEFDSECTKGKYCKDTLPTKTCVTGCRQGSTCQDATPYCTSSDTSIGQCVACLTDDNCAGATKPICAPTGTTNAFTCQACQNNTECSTRDSGKPICVSSGACGVCSDLNTSACATGICVLPLGLCGCANDSQCPAGTPICLNQLCSPCSTDGQCAGRDPSMPACTAGGDCQECSSTNLSKCSNAEPICLATTETCGCDASTQCTGTTPICNSAECTACVSDAQCAEKNPSLPACKTTGACGQCSATNTSACTKERPVCVLDTGLCGCSTDSDCGDKALCRNEMCVDIACSAQEECSGNVGGNACLVSGTCGCAVDGDCAGSGVSNACDISTQRCVALSPGDAPDSPLKGGRIEGGGLFKCSQGGEAGLYWLLLVASLAVRLIARRPSSREA